MIDRRPASPTAPPETRVGPAYRDPLAVLAAAEREVLEMAMAGLPNKAIAVRQRVAIRTVERRRAEAFRRLGVDTLVEAARLVDAARLVGAARPGEFAAEGAACRLGIGGAPPGPWLAEAFRGAAAGIALVNADGRLAAVNPAYCRLTGYSEPELLGQGLWLVTHPDDLAANVDGVGRVLGGGANSFRMRKRYLRRGGDVIAADLSITVVRGSGGVPVCSLGLVEPAA